MSEKQKNVLGEDLEECSNNPLTGWYRDGCCNTDENDHGIHTVCAKVTTEFLEWLKIAGNDLITPHPEFGFPGLKEEMVGAFVQVGMQKQLKQAKDVQCS